MSRPFPSADDSGRPSGLLASDAPPRAARWAGALLLAVSLAVALFATIAPLPETVIAPFELVPLEGSAPVQAPVPGRITRVAVREGQAVAAGELLYEIRSDSVRELAARLQALDEEQAALTARIAQRDSDHDRETAMLTAEQALLERSLALQREHEQTVATLLERKERAVESGLLAGITLLDDRLLAAESTQQRVLAEQRLQHKALEQQQRKVAHERAQADDRATQARLAPQIAALRTQLDEADGELQRVHAPHAAIVISLRVPATGAVVAIGEELARLARADAAVQARLRLPEADLARLQPGQAVRLYLTAFPYQRHGSAPAHISWVSPAVGPDATAGGFHALATLESIPEDGPRPLPGMTGEARVLVARRTLLQRALEPIRAIRERLWMD
jgi:multidrug efflux pump subunit AcrA (membrane-fusion protein)